jgi:hypothetical protein
MIVVNALLALYWPFLCARAWNIVGFKDSDIEVVWVMDQLKAISQHCQMH